MTDDGVLRIGQPPQAPRRSRSWRWPLIAAVAVIVVGAAVLAAIFVLPRIGGFDVTGTMLLNSSSWNSSTGQTCVGKGGYGDLKPGAQVIITDAAGATIAIGRLDPGRPSGTGCLFPFEVGGVPSGHDFYGVEVSHRGRVQYDSDRIREPLTLSIGS